MSLITIPGELLIKVIYAAADFNDTDLQKLFNMSMSCKYIYGEMKRQRKSIIQHYTDVFIKKPPVIQWNPSSGRPAPCFGLAPGLYETHKFNGKLHRDNDLPALIDGNLNEYYQHGKLHRDNDLPARIKYGLRAWYQHGKLHRDNDLPAVSSSDGDEWWKNGKRYYIDDKSPDAIINAYKKQTIKSDV